MRFSAHHFFTGIFFLLLTANTLLSHSIGVRVVDNARNQVALRESGVDPSTVPADENTLRRAQGLLLTNIPFFLALGAIVRAEEPATGSLYWSTLVLGATYMPLLLTLMSYLFWHAPGKGTLPGVDPDDESYKLGDEDDDRRS